MVENTAELDWRDGACAALAALIAFGVYLVTMFPGLAGIGDTPKLQFVGAVLGTPHSPGYPLYTVLSWVFSRLPLGTVAFRINLLSVVCGAAAIGPMLLVLRELGCRRLVAFAAALAIAFGRLYWSQSLLAEVYALNALLFAGVLLFLTRWARTRAFSDLAWALAFFGAGLAHHLTLAMTGPALLFYALLVDPRVITRRTATAAVIACAAGLSCYLLVWLRTYQHAPFLEVRANSLSDLVWIVSGRQFGDALFRFSSSEILTERVPLVTTWMVSELRPGGIVMAVVGAVFLAARDRRSLVLLGGCIATVTFFAFNYGVYDVQVFLLIPMIAAGLIAGVGAEAACRLVAFQPVMLRAAVIAVLLLPVVQYRENFKFNNHRRHTFEAEYFEALFKALPDRSAIVVESYPIDHMVQYKLLAEGAARGRQIDLIPADPKVVRQYLSKGFSVFAFVKGRAELEFVIPFTVADLGLPTASGGRHVADTEAPELAYPLSVARPGAGERATPVRPDESITGTAWRP